MAVDSSQRIQDFAFSIRTGDFALTADVSEKLGGKNSGPSPHAYLEVALAACTAITLQMYAKHKDIPLESSDVRIKILAEGAENHILREIALLGPLTEEQKARLLQIAEKCPIHNFLNKGARIDSILI